MSKLYIDFTHFLKIEIVLFNKLRTNMLKTVHVKFHSKSMRNVGEILNYPANL